MSDVSVMRVDIFNKKNKKNQLFRISFEIETGVAIRKFEVNTNL